VITQPRCQLDARDLHVGDMALVHGIVGWPCTWIEACYQALCSDLSATVLLSLGLHAMVGWPWCSVWIFIPLV
jgi:hypothetical protein